MASSEAAGEAGTDRDSPDVYSTKASASTSSPGSSQDLLQPREVRVHDNSTVNEPIPNLLDANEDGLKTPTSRAPHPLPSLDQTSDFHSLDKVPQNADSISSTVNQKEDSSNSRADMPPKSPTTPSTKMEEQSSEIPKDSQESLLPVTDPSGRAAQQLEDSAKGSSTETIVAPNQNSENPRPNSEPNFQSLIRSRRQDDQDHSHHLTQAQLLRAQAAESPQPYPYPRSNASSASDLGYITSGAKTTGNTPAQSPHPFSPSVTRRLGSESEESHYNAPMLQSFPLQAPKETHKLMKDVDPISGRKLVNNYELYHKLGSGQHGTVKFGKNLENGDKVAVKIVKRLTKRLRLGKPGDPNDMIKREVAILKKARHPHVVSLFEVIDDLEFSKVYLILEYVERGEVLWRKLTDKAIAMFEKDHVDHEKAGGFDEATFHAAVEQFNNGLPARRQERERLLEEARATQKQLESQNPRRKRSIADASWMSDYLAESETESIPDGSRIQQIEGDTRLSRADIHAAETASQSAYGAASIETPRSHPYPVSLEQLSSSQPNSRPESPTVFQGSVYGALSDDGKASDLDLQASLDQILSRRVQWTEDEENYRYVPCLTLSQATDVFRDTVLGLEYLHYQGIMHRDIKPANLLWTQDYRVKISDFGVSYLGKPIREDPHPDDASDADAALVDEDIELAKTVGTPAFYAPELCDPDYYDVDKTTQRPTITGQIDVWALGVTLYGMIFGRLPFYHPNEFQMYEKIAREELFIPRMRLRGVEHSDPAPTNHNKRLDDVLEYEEVDDTLRDLLKRLLAKKPSERITIKEVKHHPWVIRGIEDIHKWLEGTDPSRQDEGQKIEPSQDEIKDAVMPMQVIDQMRKTVTSGLQKFGSLMRGRSSRKRTVSNPKIPESMKDDRRSSLRGDEQIFSALRASREGSEHPLSHSLAASPEHQIGTQYFPPGPASASLDGSELHRASGNDPAMSTADSVRTIRPHSSSHLKDTRPPPITSTSEGDFSTITTPYVQGTSSNSSTLNQILGAPGRLLGSMRSRERGGDRSSPSQSSRSSSIEPNASREELHAQPSLAVSSAVAAGHVDQPPALREEVAPQAHRSSVSSTEAFQRAQEQNWRRQAAETTRPPIHRRSISMHTGDAACPPSPDDEMFAHQRPASAADSSFGFPAISSSSDMMVSGDSAVHSRIPSIVSGASSLSVAPEEGLLEPLRKDLMISPTSTIDRPPTSQSNPASATSVETQSAQLSKAPAGEDAGYVGEPEDSDSEDEGLAMA